MGRGCRALARWRSSAGTWLYVVGLRHGTPGQDKPSALSSHQAVAALSLADLAEQSDKGCVKTLQKGGLDKSRCGEGFLLRTQTPFVSIVEGPMHFEKHGRCLSTCVARWSAGMGHWHSGWRFPPIWTVSSKRSFAAD